MKKIALISLGKLLDWYDICEPLQLGYLAAFMKQRGISVKIIDEAAGDNIETELAGYAPDYVGVTATTPLVNRAYNILTFCRRQGYTTIIGGVHASTMPEEAKQYADYVVVGEGENALYSIITENLPHGIIKYPHVENLDDLPFPDRSLINMEFYARQKVKEPINIYHFLPQGMSIATIITSRGCPYGCIYCHNSWRDAPARYQSAGRVFNEIVEIKNKYNIDALFFTDDDIFINKRRMLDICNRLEHANLNLIWVGNARVSSVDKEVLEAAYRAGCRQIFYGIESGSQKAIDILGKKTTIQQAQEAIRLTKEAGIIVCGGFMIGIPGETLDDIRKTKNFIFSNPIDVLNLSIATPYPGTALWDHCRTRNLIPESFNWDSFRFDHGGISANELFTNKQLEKMRFRILIEVFFKFNIKSSFFYLKHPSFIISRFVGALIAILGLKPEKEA